MRNAKQDLKSVIDACMAASQSAWTNSPSSCAANSKAALATVVCVSGSSYRRPGARLFIAEDKTTFGAISGGCLEADVALRAQESIESGQPILLNYSTSGTDDIEFGLGMGCNGQVDILVEPLADSNSQAACQFICHCLEQSEEGVLVTIYRAEGTSDFRRGQHFTFSADQLGAATSMQHLDADIFADARLAFAEKRTFSAVYKLPGGGSIHALIEIVRPPVTLLVCGTGDDALPLVAIADQLGWTTVVVDVRQSQASNAKFASTNRILSCPAEQLPERLGQTNRMAAVIMTHNYEQDLALLKTLSIINLAYLGVLGPRSRTLRLVQDLALSGNSMIDRLLSRLHGPIGLDIGAETAAEIALSVISEIQAVLSGYGSGHLRDRDGPIHNRTDSAEATAKSAPVTTTSKPRTCNP